MEVKLSSCCVCSSCWANNIGINSEGSASKLLLSQMQGEKTTVEYLKMSKERQNIVKS